MEYSKIRIKSVPLGEAPYWVREAWVGLELPCPYYTDSSAGTGVLSGIEGPHGIKMYVVCRETALEELRKNGKQAAYEWWKECCFVCPICEEDAGLGFEQECLEELGRVPGEEEFLVEFDKEVSAKVLEN